MFASMIASWNEIYSNSAVWRSVILFGHMGGLLLAGGCAIAADRQTLLARPGDTQLLTALSTIHRVVIVGLSSMIVSGALMLAANLDTYLASRWFWLKMGLVAILLVNGLLLMRAEDAARASEPQAWSRLRTTSIVSLVLWFVITFIGTVLPNV